VARNCGQGGSFGADLHHVRHVQPHGSWNICHEPPILFLSPHLSSKPGSRGAQAGGGSNYDEEGDMGRDVNGPGLPTGNSPIGERGWEQI
jgi:hypothetical protein